jgi:hypothetical protein
MEMVVANALLVEQWYQQLIVSSLSKKSGVVSSIRIWCASINCHVCRIQQLVASLENLHIVISGSIAPDLEFEFPRTPE